ncbi:MAG TPA: efflux RND transporter permease subunit [Elusimicrobiota bacterium]|nr:efflux RND transporter permease subunit [Elusimicrobiota bacterium]
MNLVRGSMRRPVTVLVAVVAVALGAVLAALKMPRDVLPNLGVPTIYVAQPYGGMSPAQMDGYLAYYYEYHFLFIAGIKHVESKSIQGISLIKLQFQPGTNMAEAMAETVNYANRARSFMPPGTVPPFIMRFDAGSVPVGDLVFKSSSETVGQIQDLALNRVRPLFATLPGVSAPPPFGASQRTIVVRVDPVKLRNYNLSPDDVAEAISKANLVSPAGNIDLGDRYPMVRLNSVVTNIKELESVPLRTGTYPTVFLRDVGRVEDATDLPTGYALVNGRRAVYIPVTKLAGASTLSVVNLVRRNLKKFQSVLPDDVRVSYEFDQSGYVRRAIRALIFEGGLGAILTGLMVLLFLRDWRSSLIVVANIPLALCAALLALWLCGQTVNIMTLGGLALAVGILVDEATVTVENIHSHLARGQEVARASLDATAETILPRMLAMLCVLSVFIPSFFMTGAARALFVPLSLAVGFSMVGSYLLSGSFVPIVSTWLLRGRAPERHSDSGRFAALRRRYASVLDRASRRAWPLIALYFLLSLGVIAWILPRLGRELFPEVAAGQLQLRLRAPAGTAIDGTERIAEQVLDLIKRDAGEGNVNISIGFVGVQPPNYPINTIYLWTSGPEEAVLQVDLKRRVSLEALKERLRREIPADMPGVRVSFEPADIVSRVMSQGAPTPIEVALSGPDFSATQAYAKKVLSALQGVKSLRDLQLAQTLNYPSVNVTMNREKAGLMGLTVSRVGRALTAATSSSRYVLPDFWADPKSGIAYQVQVEVPQSRMASLDAVRRIPVAVGGGAVPLERFATVVSSVAVGEYDRYDMQRMLTFTANVAGSDLGRAAARVRRALASVESAKPKNVTVALRGEVAPMQEMFHGLRAGLGLAVVVILLLLAANFQSWKLSLIVLSTVPAVLAGAGLMLAATGTTLNVESFMGATMAIGVAVANAILLVTFAERSRIEGKLGFAAASAGAASRLRPILMTSCAMIVGMIPMALGLGESSRQTAPLARAVIGGLAAATAATLLVLPLIYGHFERGPARSASLDPDDHEAR